jgi:NitT/TauT family transport system ATP-binding protein
VSLTADPTSRALGVTLEGVSRTFDSGMTAVDRISLNIEPGDFAVLLGPSGCGKSTLLRLIAGLDRPTRGEVAVGGRPPRSRGGHDLAYVFQDPHLMPWRNVLRNVALPLELRGISKKERYAVAREAIEQVGLGEFSRHYPAQLSGGMRMRVSLARALVTDPKLLLLDEPFAALDELTRHALDEQLHQLWHRRGMTVLFVTHSTAEAAFLGRRAIVFSPRPGRIVLDHPIPLPQPRTAAVRGEPAYAGQMRMLYDALKGN